MKNKGKNNAKPKNFTRPFDYSVKIKMDDMLVRGLLGGWHAYSRLGIADNIVNISATA